MVVVVDDRQKRAGGRARKLPMFQNFATKITVYREKLLVENCLPRGISSGESYPLESSEEKVSRDPLRVVDTRKRKVL